MLHARQPCAVIPTETTSFWRLKYLSFEGYLDKKKWSIFLVIKCMQRFFVTFRQFVYPLALRHNDVGETGLNGPST